MIKHGFVAVATVAVLGVAGCGGGGSGSNKKLSYSDFSTQANDICKTANAKSAGAKLTNDLKADAAVLDQQIPSVESALADFKKLNPPDELKADYDKFLSISDQQLASAKKARDAAKAGDQTGFVTALKAAAPLQAQSHAEGSKLGAAECAK
jgi:hypothetical protein